MVKLERELVRGTTNIKFYWFINSSIKSLFIRQEYTDEGTGSSGRSVLESIFFHCTESLFLHSTVHCSYRLPVTISDTPGDVLYGVVPQSRTSPRIRQ